MRKEIWFGLSILVAVVLGIVILMPAPADMTNGHLGLLMLALIVVTIMLGFPTAFTLMGMGVIFTLLAYRNMGWDLAIQQTLDLMVLRTYAVMTNDVLIAVPLFIFMGYLVERANLIQSLFQGMHLALSRIPGSLAVATIATCALFATATGIVGAVVTLMGLLALPAMLRAGYGVQLSAGSITAVRAVDMPGERIIGKSPARQVAHMTVARSNGNTMLSLEVAIQRQGAAVRTALAATDSYSSVPNYTSAEMESLPAEQMESWQRTGRDHKLETDIIQDIRKRLQ